MNDDSIKKALGISAERSATAGARENLRTAAAMFNMLAGDKFFIAFQPVREACRGRLIYQECLIRMRSLEDGMTYGAGEFIPFLKRQMLMPTVDLITLQNVIVLLMNHQRLKLSVNVSATDIVTAAWRRLILEQLMSIRCVARRLVLEILETSQVDREHTRRVIRKLRRAGCKIAIDDWNFGHGRFNARVLGRAEFVKIRDEQILKRNGGSTLHRLITEARAHGDSVIVEGIERYGQLRMCQRQRVFVQGYLVGRPGRMRDK